MSCSEVEIICVKVKGWTVLITGVLAFSNHDNMKPTQDLVSLFMCDTTELGFFNPPPVPVDIKFTYEVSPNFCRHNFLCVRGCLHHQQYLFRIKSTE